MKHPRPFGVWLALLASACGGAGSGAAGGDPDARGGAAGASAGAGGGVSAGSGGGNELGGAPGMGGSAAAPGGDDAGSSPAVPPGTPASVEAVSGNGAALLEGWPGGTLKVRVEDSAGAPVAGATVTWSVVSGQGANLTSPGQPTDTTDQQGVAARMLQGVGFASHEPFGQTVIRASTSAGSVDFVAITVHQTTAGPIGPLLVLAEPQSYDFGDVKAGSVLKGAAKLQAVVQAGVFSGTPLPNVALRFVDPSDKELDGVANCAGGAALTDASGVAWCDLVVGSQLGSHTISALGGESTLFSAIHLNVVP